jgi:8-oxo-dGTP diphosphatase
VPEYKNPKPTADAIIDGGDGRIVLIKRNNPPKGWAIPGGFVDEGEAIEHAAIREAKEETGLDVELITQLFTYSDPKRDPRQHNVSTVYAARVKPGAEPKGADDADEARWFAEKEIPWAELCFDHAAILRDYFEWKKTGKRRALWP